MNDPKTIEEYVEMLDNVSDESIENLFEEMGIDINLNREWDVSQNSFTIISTPSSKLNREWDDE